MGQNKTKTKFVSIFNYDKLIDIRINVKKDIKRGLEFVNWSFIIEKCSWKTIGKTLWFSYTWLLHLDPCMCGKNSLPCVICLHNWPGQIVLLCTLAFCCLNNKWQYDKCSWDLCQVRWDEVRARERERECQLWCHADMCLWNLSFLHLDTPQGAIGIRKMATNRFVESLFSSFLLCGVFFQQLFWVSACLNPPVPSAIIQNAPRWNILIAIHTLKATSRLDPDTFGPCRRLRYLKIFGCDDVKTDPLGISWRFDNWHKAMLYLVKPANKLLTKT